MTESYSRFLHRVIPAGLTAAAVLVCAWPAAAQSEAALKLAFEGHRVIVRIDMPGTSDGVNVRVDRRRQIDFGDYRDNLKRYPVAIRSGDWATVTLVKVKKDLIEFQLGGGGYGTFGDDTSTSVYIPYVEKSDREKELETRVKEESDGDRRRDLRRQLNEVRERRERQNRRIDLEREWAEARKTEEIAQKRREGGSRFNIRYDDRVPSGIAAVEVMAALAEYVDFDRADPRSDVASSVDLAEPTGDTTMLHKGMTRAEVERAFGRPVESSGRTAAALTIATLIFYVGDERVTADFVEDVLVRYTIASK